MPPSRPSLLSANGLYLLSLLLIVSAGSLLQSWSLSWGLLATEVFLILLPTLAALRLQNLPLRETLNLRWPGGRAVVLGLFAGAGVWALGLMLEGLGAALLGYTPTSPFAALPNDPLTLSVFALALAVSAPLCEETLFRGYLLSAYGRFSPRVAVLAVSLLFAFFHLRLQGLLALLPVALALGVLAQRSRSLWPAIAAHFANNSLGAALAILAAHTPGLTSDPAWMGLIGAVILGGPVVAAVALWAFRRRFPAQPATPVEPAAPGERRAWWPLAGAAAVYVVFAGLELIQGRFPALLAEPTLQLGPAPWTAPTRLAYDLRNVLNETVGESVCTFTPQGAAVAFDCLTRQRRFEAQLGRSFYAGGRYELAQTGRWEAGSLKVLNAHLDFRGEYDSWVADLEPAAEALRLSVVGRAPELIPADTVIAAEWRWRMMALPFGRPFYLGSRLTQLRLRPGEGSARREPAVVLMRGQQDLPGPAGPTRAWKVALGAETAWYSVEPPHTLLQFADGYGVTWVLRAER